MTIASRAALLLLLAIVGMALLISTAEVFPIQPGSPLYNYTEQSQSVQHGSFAWQGNDVGGLKSNLGTCNGDDCYLGIQDNECDGNTAKSRAWKIGNSDQVYDHDGCDGYEWWKDINFNGDWHDVCDTRQRDWSDPCSGDSLHAE